MTLTREYVNDLVERLRRVWADDLGNGLVDEAATALLAAWEKMPDECGHPFCGPTCGSDPLLTRAEAAEAKLAALTARLAELADTVKKAANRLDWCAGLLPSETSRDQATAWADETRAALNKEPKP